MAAMMTAVELAGYAWVLYHIWSMNETRAMLDGIVVFGVGCGIYHYGKRKIAFLRKI